MNWEGETPSSKDLNKLRFNSRVLISRKEEINMIGNVSSFTRIYQPEENKITLIVVTVMAFFRFH
jgi:hypothetical protein